jgi:hypothetical protein
MAQCDLSATVFYAAKSHRCHPGQWPCHHAPGASLLELEISIKTAEKHRQHLMEKLDTHDMAGLTRFAIASGSIEVRG